METLALTQKDFESPTRGINLGSFTNIGISEREFSNRYGKGTHSVLTTAQMAELIYKSQELTDIEKADLASEELLKVERVLVDLEKGGQSLVFCIEIPKANEIEKAGGDDLQKAVLDTYQSKLEFKKKGKDIKDKLATVKTNINTRIAQMSIALAALQVAIGEDPSEIAQNWYYRGNDQSNIGVYLTYPNEMCYYNDRDGLSGSMGGNFTKDQCVQCREYNDAVYNIISLKCDLAECDMYINNLEDGDTYTLSGDQMRTLGY